MMYPRLVERKPDQLIDGGVLVLLKIPLQPDGDPTENLRTFESRRSVQFYGACPCHEHLHDLVSRKDATASDDRNTENLRQLMHAPERDGENCLPCYPTATAFDTELRLGRIGIDKHAGADAIRAYDGVSSEHLSPVRHRNERGGIRELDPDRRFRDTPHLSHELFEVNGIDVQVPVKGARMRAGNVNLVRVDAERVEDLDEIGAAFGIPAGERNDDRSARNFRLEHTAVSPIRPRLFISPFAVQHAALVEDRIAGNGDAATFRRNMFFEGTSNDTGTAVRLRCLEEVRCFGDIA